MIGFQTFDDVARVKDSEGAVQIVNELLSLINGKGGKGEVYCPSFDLIAKTLGFSLSVSIPFQGYKYPRKTHRGPSGSFLKAFQKTVKEENKIRFDTLDDVACLKDSDDVVQKAKEILSFINDKSDKWEMDYYSLYLKGTLLEFSLLVAIPFHFQQSSEPCTK